MKRIAKEIKKPEISRKEFGQWMKSLMKECGYTPTTLAPLLYSGVSKPDSQKISQITGGANLLPKACIKNFCDIFRLDQDQFLLLYVAVIRSDIKASISQSK